MGILAKDVAKLVGKKDNKKLGDILFGKFSDIKIDSVKEVRNIRERN